MLYFSKLCSIILNLALFSLIRKKEHCGFNSSTVWHLECFPLMCMASILRCFVCIVLSLVACNKLNFHVLEHIWCTTNHNLDNLSPMKKRRFLFPPGSVISQALQDVQGRIYWGGGGVVQEQLHPTESKAYYRVIPYQINTKNFFF